SSTTSTDAPRRASSYATADPMMPAPTTMMSDGRDTDRTLSQFSALQHVERMSVLLVVAEPWNAPEHTEWLDGPRRFRRAHVGAFPAERVDDFSDDALRRGVVAAIEHRGLHAAGKRRIHHQIAADAVERLDELRVGHGLLQPLHQRIVGRREELQD